MSSAREASVLSRRGSGEAESSVSAPAPNLGGSQEPRPSDELLRLALDGAEMGAWDYDIAADRVFWDARTRELFGVGPDEDIDYGKVVRGIVHPDDRDRVHAAAQSAFDPAGDGVYDVEHRVVHPDGSVRWLAVRGRAFFSDSPDGSEPRRAVRLLGVAQDVTTAKQAEQSLRESEARFRRLAESNIIGMVIWNADGEFVEANDAFLDMLGFTREELRAGFVRWDRLTPPEQLATSYQNIELLRQTGVCPTVEKEYFRKDGSRVPVLVNAATFAERGGDVGIALVLDLTDNARLTRELREADRRKDQFLATLAHELRNPLNPVRTALQLFRLTYGDRAAFERTLQMMERQVGQMVRLIDDLMDISRITRDKVAVRKAPTELAAVLQSALEMSRPLVEARRHELTVVLPSEPIVLEADAARLSQVFSNLLNNAAKYTEPGGRIWLTAARDGAEAVVRVRDNGIGIPPDRLAQIFEPFIQVDSSLERSQGGLGIGLTLVQRLLELHGGTVMAHSEGLGRGSELVVRLPAPDRPQG
ncbi:MAG TPA: ATP-binding protein [Thermoanaerobaculia bacterium]|nr:ATP-binding protein [Thermoanaerobaculia bacterium]